MLKRHLLTAFTALVISGCSEASPPASRTPAETSQTPTPSLTTTASDLEAKNDRVQELSRLIIADKEKALAFLAEGNMQDSCHYGRRMVANFQEMKAVIDTMPSFLQDQVMGSLVKGQQGANEVEAACDTAGF